MTENPKLSVEKQVEFQIPAINFQWFELEVKGVSELIIHHFSEKTRKQMEDKQQGKAKGQRQEAA